MINRIITILCSSVLLLLPLWANAVQQVDSVRLHRAPDHTRIVFDLDENVEHKVFVLTNPDRVVLDLTDVELSYDLQKLALKDTPIKGLRVGHHEANRVRVVFDLSESIKPRTNVLKPVEPHGWRLVLDLFDQEPKAIKPQPSTPTLSTKGPRRMVVAIDAGHGGEDPGALGPTGLREKDVVLQIAKRLHDLLKKEPGITPVLVRDGDYYVPLAERRRIAAEDHDADLFLSIHADAFTDARAYGASVFRLSQNGASSATAQHLAKIENNSDRIAGIYEEEKDNSGLLGVLADLRMRGVLTHSAVLGKHLLSELGHITPLHGGRRTVEEANFAVLREPKMVSVLVETGFISNREEERKLRSAAHQDKLARALRNGIYQYFKDNPTPDTWFDAQRRENGGTRITHKIQSGETLSYIAQQYSISEARLREVNQLSGDMIRVGQTLQIPDL